jgi:putative glycosyltransferase (TIGR04348 family)
MMRICLITPAPPRSRKGNRVTALRWARILQDLGHRVLLREEYTGQRCDLLIALHALKSAPSIRSFRERHPTAPLLLALTGTDLYDSIHTHEEAQVSLNLASRLIVLQPLGIEELPWHLRPRVRVIYQSAAAPSFLTSARARRPARLFPVCVLGHLREVKDPFRTAKAAALLPATSRIRVYHLGAALSPEMEEQARQEENINPRYRWLGERSRARALGLLARCRLLSLTSLQEGGANVLSEALAVSVPVISSHIPGSVGVLGEGYPGFFQVGDTRALADLLGRAETDQEFYRSLESHCASRRTLFDPARERASWEALLAEVVSGEWIG